MGYLCLFHASDLDVGSVSSGDRVRAGALPGQVPGVHLRVLQHPGVRTGQHPFHQGGERSVSRFTDSVSVKKEV